MNSAQASEESAITGPAFLSGSFPQPFRPEKCVVLGLALKSSIHFEVNFVNVIRCRSSFIHFHVNVLFFPKSIY